MGKEWPCSHITQPGALLSIGQAPMVLSAAVRDSRSFILAQALPWVALF